MLAWVWGRFGSKGTRCSKDTWCTFATKASLIPRPTWEGLVTRLPYMCTLSLCTSQVYMHSIYTCSTVGAVASQRCYGWGQRMRVSRYMAGFVGKEGLHSRMITTSLERSLWRKRPTSHSWNFVREQQTLAAALFWLCRHWYPHGWPGIQLNVLRSVSSYYS